MLLVPMIILAGIVITWGAIKEREKSEIKNQIVELKEQLVECEKKLAIPKRCNCKKYEKVESVAVWKEMAESCIAEKLRVHAK